jgi:integrase
MPSKVKKKGRTIGWRAQVRRQGIRKDQLCKTKDEALALESQWIAEISRAQTGIVMALDWADQYLDYCQDRYVKVTYQSKREAFDYLVRHTGDVPVADIAAGDMLNMLTTIKQARTGYTANKIRKDLVAGWNWGKKYIPCWPQVPNPIAQVAQFGYQKQARYVPPMDDVLTVLDSMKGQDRTMLMAYLHTGARPDEMFRLKWQDIDFANSRISLWTRKRQDGSWECDTIPMTRQLRDALINHRANSDGKGYVFTHDGKQYKHRQHWLKYWCGVVGVPRFTIKSIRHLTASWLYEQGVPVKTIQMILRHKKATTTDRYLHELVGARVDMDSVFENKRGDVIEMKKASGSAVPEGL